MEHSSRTNPHDHLSDDELFALAVPAVGTPEPLPAHLSECLRCSRALADWKGAVRDLAGEDEEALSRRSADGWRAVEDATLDAIRREGAPGRGRKTRTLRWALPAAASLLLFALLAGRPDRTGPAVVADEDTSGFSAQDRADDALLRDVERLASGEETSGWGALVPEPVAPAETAIEERS